MSICTTSLTPIAYCDFSPGGIKNIYALPFGYVTGSTIVNGQVTVIGSSGATKFVNIQIPKDSATYSEVDAQNQATGGIEWTTTLTIKLAKRNLAVRNAIKLLGSGNQNLIMLIESNEGTFWLQGLGRGANVTAGTNASNAALTDGTTSEVIIISKEVEQMYSVDPTIVTALIS